MRQALLCGALLALAACSGETSKQLTSVASPPAEVHVIAATITVGKGGDAILGFAAHNAGYTADRLVGAACTCAERAEIVGPSEIEPEETGLFGPTGDHVILHGMDPGVSVGDFVDVVVTFELAGDVATQAEVVRT
jgi:copper(I)-binding protein